MAVGLGPQTHRFLPSVTQSDPGYVAMSMTFKLQVVYKGLAIGYPSAIKIKSLGNKTCDVALTHSHIWKP